VDAAAEGGLGKVRTCAPALPVFEDGGSSGICDADGKTRLQRGAGATRQCTGEADAGAGQYVR